jgi:hypothetical protein
MRKSARTDLCGGRLVMIVPTASIDSEPTLFAGKALVPFSIFIRHANQSLP